MRFERFPKNLRLESTPLRLRNAERKIAREKEKYALFAAEITETAEQRSDRVLVGLVRHWQGMRNIRAAAWRKFRAMVRDDDSGQVAAAWLSWRGPRSVEYALDLADAVLRCSSSCKIGGGAPDATLDTETCLMGPAFPA